MEPKYYVYLHLNPKTEEIFYVGMGCDNRDKDFKYGRNLYYLNYVSKHGLPLVKRIKENLSKNEASELEKEYISLYGRKYLGKGTLTNISEGGEYGVKGRKYNMTKEHKEKISNSNKNTSKHTPESKSKISQANSGYTHTPETKEKIRQSRLGKKASQSTKEKMSNLRKGRVINWKLGGKPRPSTSKIQSKSIKQLDLQGNFLKLWGSMKEAGNFLNIHPSGISACCRGKYQTAGGFKWLYNYGEKNQAKDTDGN